MLQKLLDYLFNLLDFHKAEEYLSENSGSVEYQQDRCDRDIAQRAVAPPDCVIGVSDRVWNIHTVR